jgi:hypothetical protein
MPVDMKNARVRAGEIPQEVRHDLGHIAKQIDALAADLVNDDLPLDTIVRRLQYEAAELKIMAGVTCGKAVESATGTAAS